MTLKNRKEERGNSLSITVMPMEKNRSVTVGNKVKRVPGARPQGRRSCGSRNAVVGNQRKTAMKVGLAFAVLAILLLFLFLLPPFMQTTDASTRKMRVVGYESVRVHRGISNCTFSHNSTLLCHSEERSDEESRQLCEYYLRGFFGCLSMQKNVHTLV